MGEDKLKCGAKRKFFVLNLEKAEEKIHPMDLDRIEFGLTEIDFALSSYPDIKAKEYLVINTDEPYAEEVIDILKRNGHWG